MSQPADSRYVSCSRRGDASFGWECSRNGGDMQELSGENGDAVSEQAFQACYR
ncbi:MAG: hypothetical protein RJA70_2960 [Pseudomonadota bacterium]